MKYEMSDSAFNLFQEVVHQNINSLSDLNTESNSEHRYVLQNKNNSSRIAVTVLDNIVEKFVKEYIS